MLAASHWQDVPGVPILGGQQVIEDLYKKNLFDAAVVSVSTSIPFRQRTHSMLVKLSIPLANVIDPSARVQRNAVLGVGNVTRILPHWCLRENWGWQLLEPLRRYRASLRSGRFLHVWPGSDDEFTGWTCMRATSLIYERLTMYSANSGRKSIPFVDLVAPHVELEQELTEVFRRALLTAGFIGGQVVEEFEKAFAKFCGTSQSIAVSSGTDALRFAIIASGVRPGDAVLTVPHTFIATTEAISQSGAFPEFIDIDDQTYNMSVEMLQRFLEEKCSWNNAGKLVSRRSGRPVTAVVPVHLYGQMADMDSILKACQRVWPRSWLRMLARPTGLSISQRNSIAG